MKRPFNYEPAEEMLEILIAQDKIAGWEILNPGQYRISGKLDIFPKSQKYFYIPKNEWGNYIDLESLIYNLKHDLPPNYKASPFTPLLHRRKHGRQNMPLRNRKRARRKKSKVPQPAADLQRDNLPLKP